MSDELSPRQRVRIHYEKGEAIKFISNNDETRLWERALRRADLPLLYKQGFNPQPHLQFAAPLGVGITGVREPLDIIFSPPLPLDELQARIAAKLPPGVTLHTIEEVPVKTDALQTRIMGADYWILIFAEPDEILPSDIHARLETFRAMRVIPRERQRKGLRYTYNLRPLVFDLHYLGYDPQVEEHRIFLRVQARPGATGRPDEVVDALGFDDYARTLRRERLYYDHVPEDVALFAEYPHVQQEEITIAREQPKRRNKRHKRRPSPARPEQAGRSINERAADEFA